MTQEFSGIQHLHLDIQQALTWSDDKLQCTHASAAYVQKLLYRIHAFIQAFIEVVLVEFVVIFCIGFLMAQAWRR